MWLFLNDGFLSVVADKYNPSRLMVRARRKQDLLNIFGAGIEVTETTHSDYRWRTFVERDTMKQLMTQRLDAVDYTNFKNSVRDSELHDLYLDFWQIHNRYQR